MFKNLAKEGVLKNAKTAGNLIARSIQWYLETKMRGEFKTKA